MRDNSKMSPSTDTHANFRPARRSRFSLLRAMRGSAQEALQHQIKNEKNNDNSHYPADLI
jgi:hypothetical protein